MRKRMCCLFGSGWLVLATALNAASLMAGEVKPVWQAGWEKVVEGAKRDRQLHVHAPTNQAQIINEGGFQRRYPDIRIVPVVAQGGVAVQKILSERRAGKYLADVIVGGGVVDRELNRAGALDPIKPAFLLPEVVDESKWWLGQHHYADPERKYTFTYIGAPSTVNIYYNTSLVSPKELGSIWDLLNPKWKGKIVTYDVRGGGAGGGTTRFIYYHPKLGPDFIRRLFGEMEITLTRDYRRQATDWLATGKFSICLICNYTEIQKAKAHGLPLDTVSFGAVEGIAGLTAEGGSVSLANRAPHPNAATLFINWLLSREGQITAQTALMAYGSQAVDSLRIDIPKDSIPVNNRRVDGVEHLDLQEPGRLDMRPIFKVIEAALARRK